MLDRNVIKEFVPFVDFTPGNNKVISPPGIDSTTEWKLLFARVRYISSSAAGRRQLGMSLANENGELLYQVPSRVRIEPSQNVLHTFVAGSRRDSSGFSLPGFHDFVELSIPEHLIVHRGHTLRFRDVRDVHAATDVLRISGMIAVLR